MIMSENKKWSSFLEGDKYALSDIFTFYHDDLYRYGIKLAKDGELVSDCIQNLFLKLWKNRENLKPVQSVKPYLLKSLRNHIMDSLQIRRLFLPINKEVEELFEIKFSQEDFMINEQIQKEIQAKVIELLNNLSPHQRHAIYLRYFEDLDFETIAHIMDMQVQSVRNTISRGLNVLRNLMVISYFFVMLGKPD